MSAYILHTVSMANSLLMPSFLMEFSISPVSMGSDNSMMCPCRISASFSPTLVAKSAASTSVSFTLCSSAPLKRPSSASTSETFSLLMTSSASSTITALPIPIPDEALVPFFIMITSLLY